MCGPPGARLPTEYTISVPMSDVKDPHVWTRAHSEHEFPQQSTLSWASEQKYGMTLLEPSIRNDFEDTNLLINPVRQRVPSGWLADEEDNPVLD